MSILRTKNKKIQTYRIVEKGLVLVNKIIIATKRIMNKKNSNNF